MAQKPRRERRRMSQVAASDVDVGSAPFKPDVPVESGMETAAIGDVTPAMMDEVAHRAAEAVEAAAHRVVIEAGHGDVEHRGEPVPPAIGEPATVTPIRSESHGFVAETDASDSLAVAVRPIDVASMGASTPGEAFEETTPPTLPPVQAVEPSDAAAGEAAASTTLEATFVEGALAADSVDVSPLVDLPASATEPVEPAGETLRRSLPLPGETIGTYGAQVVDMLAANMAATGQFLTALMGATSVTEVVAVNTQHLRRQVELLTAQGRQLTTLARAITLDAMKPFGPSSMDH